MSINSDVAMSFPKAHVEYAHSSVTEHDGEASLSFAARVKDNAARDRSRLVDNNRRKHPDWPESWIQERAYLRRVTSGDWLVQGVARRIVLGDIDEFRLFLQMHVRTRLLEYYKNHDEYIEVWPLFVALAINDRLAIESYKQIATYPLAGTRGAEAERLFNAVHAMLRNATLEQLSQLPLHTKQGCAAWMKGCLEVFQGMVKEDQAAVNKSFAKILSGFHKSQQINVLEKSIAFCAHGLYRLITDVVPEMTPDFDVHSNTSWDSELHVSKVPLALSAKHFPNAPQSVVDAIVHCKLPPWETELSKN